MHPTELFLSHASADEPAATSIAGTLRRHGVPVWYSRSNILGAQQWHDEIGAALRRCDWFAVLLTPRSVDSMWVKRELVYALQQPRFENRIVPVLLEPCDHERLSWVLSSLQIIELQRGDGPEYAQLLRLWGIGYRPA